MHRSALIVGATGLVGQRLLARLLDQFGARLRYVLVKNQIRGDDFSQLEKSGEQARAVAFGAQIMRDEPTLTWVWPARMAKRSDRFMRMGKLTE